MLGVGRGPGGRPRVPWIGCRPNSSETQTICLNRTETREIVDGPAQRTASSDGDLRPGYERRSPLHRGPRRAARHRGRRVLGRQHGAGVRRPLGGRGRGRDALGRRTAGDAHDRGGRTRVRRVVRHGRDRRHPPGALHVRRAARRRRAVDARRPAPAGPAPAPTSDPTAGPTPVAPAGPVGRPERRRHATRIRRGRAPAVAELSGRATRSLADDAGGTDHSGHTDDTPDHDGPGTDHAAGHPDDTPDHGDPAGAHHAARAADRDGPGTDHAATRRRPRRRRPRLRRPSRSRPPRRRPARPP